jgi:hypothetical protein
MRISTVIRLLWRSRGGYATTVAYVVLATVMGATTIVATNLVGARLNNLFHHTAGYLDQPPR